MKKINKLITGIVFLSLIFPYIHFGIVIDQGVKPIFHTALLLITYMVSKSLTIKIMFFGLVLIGIETFVSSYITNSYNNVNILNILALTLILTYKKISDLILLYPKNFISFKGMFALPPFFYGAMIFSIIVSAELASNLNKFFTGFPHHEGLRGVTYFSNEPGLSSFGIFTFFVLYLTIIKDNVIKFNAVIIVAILVLLSTVSGTGLVLALILVTLFVKIKIILIALLILLIIYQFLNTELSFIMYPIERLLQLLNFKEYGESSPALRINNILDLFNNFVGMYEERKEYGHHGVGFVSYITEIPVSTIFFIIFGLYYISIYYFPLFFFSLVMLPLSSPFFFFIVLMSSYTNFNSINRSKIFLK